MRMTSLAGILVCGILGAGASAGIVVSFPAAADNTLYEAAAGNISNGRGESLFVGTTAIGELRRGLIRFDLSSLPAGALITSAKLTMTMTRTITGPEPVSLHAASASWGEGDSIVVGEGGKGAPAGVGDATWLHRFYSDTTWATPGGDFTSTSSASVLVGGNGSYSWESSGLLNDVRGWATSPLSNFGWVMRGNEGTSTTAKRFATREAMDESTRPVLEVEYIPGPGSALVISSTAMIVGGRRRRLHGT